MARACDLARTFWEHGAPYGKSGLELELFSRHHTRSDDLRGTLLNGMIVIPV
jgi:hypothetical protein